MKTEISVSYSTTSCSLRYIGRLLLLYEVIWRRRDEVNNRCPGVVNEYIPYSNAIVLVSRGRFNYLCLRDPPRNAFERINISASK